MTPVKADEGYWSVSRSPRYSYALALPLLLAYEGLAALLSGNAGGVRNGADVLIKQALYSLAGGQGSLAIMMGVVLLFVWLAIRDRRRSGQPLRASVFVRMLGESAVLAALFGLVVGVATSKLLHAVGALSIVQAAPGRAPAAATMDLPTRVMLSLGAGLYEELLFRVVLVTGLAWASRVVLGLGRGSSGAVAVVVSALVFSAFHYVGPMGDAFTLQSFVFRAIAGVLFSALFLLRGFGITAWAHAVYDVAILVIVGQ
ncbi:MAG: Abortive infection protein [Gemmatimonadetes bacterium]|nr:Abortive infection protein [Gemmatimonadota bacterium]